MKRLDTPYGSYEYDERIGTTDPLAGVLFHVPGGDRTPIYDQLRRETGLDPAPSAFDRERIQDRVAASIRFRLGLEIRYSPFLHPNKAFFLTGI